jgi:hypothetical protein
LRDKAERRTRPPYPDWLQVAEVRRGLAFDEHLPPLGEHSAAIVLFHRGDAIVSGVDAEQFIITFDAHRKQRPQTGLSMARPAIETIHLVRPAELTASTPDCCR